MVMEKQKMIMHECQKSYFHKKILNGEKVKNEN